MPVNLRETTVVFSVNKTVDLLTRKMFITNCKYTYKRTALLINAKNIKVIINTEVPCAYTFISKTNFAKNPAKGGIPANDNKQIISTIL